MVAPYGVVGESLLNKIIMFRWLHHLPELSSNANMMATFDRKLLKVA